MTQFQLDTSGAVGLNLDGKVDPDWMNETAWTFADLSPFTQGYIEALFASLSADEHRNGVVLGVRAFPDGRLRAPAFSDLAPETLARIIADTADWKLRRGEYTRKQGAAMWAKRSALGGFGAAFPPLTVQLGDDGKVQFGEPAQ